MSTRICPNPHPEVEIGPLRMIRERPEEIKDSREELHDWENTAVYAEERTTMRQISVIK